MTEENKVKFIFRDNHARVLIAVLSIVLAMTALSGRISSNRIDDMERFIDVITNHHAHLMERFEAIESEKRERDRVQHESEILQYLPSDATQ